jgi:hypothetical protein
VKTAERRKRTARRIYPIRLYSLRDQLYSLRKRVSLQSKTAKKERKGGGLDSVALLSSFSSESALLRDAGISMPADKTVRGKNVSLLFGDELAHRQRQILIEYVSIGLLGLVFALFGGLKKGMVAAAEFGFQVSPYAMESARCGAGLLDVVNAILVKNLLEISAEACALQRFGQEIAFQRLVLQVFADVSKAFLTIEKDAELVQGPPAVRDSPPPAASRRNRENPTPLPTDSKDRQAECARRRVQKDRCGDCP